MRGANGLEGEERAPKEKEEFERGGYKRSRAEVGGLVSFDEQGPQIFCGFWTDWMIHNDLKQRTSLCMSRIQWGDWPSVRLLSNDRYPPTLPLSSLPTVRLQFGGNWVQSDQPEKSPCTCPLHEKCTKSICHQTCGGSGLFVRPATHRFGSDPHCIVSGKPEARVLRGGGHLWPDKGGKGISQPTPWGRHRYSGRFVSQLKQRGGAFSQMPLQVACTVLLTLKGSRWLRSHTSPLPSDKCSSSQFSLRCLPIKIICRFPSSWHIGCKDNVGIFSQPGAG